MPGQRGSEQRQRTITLATRWSPEEYQLLDDIAQCSGVSRAEVLRRLVQRDHRNIVPTRELTSAILRLGNNVNQIAGQLNAGDRIPRNTLDLVYGQMLAALTNLQS